MHIAIIPDGNRRWADRKGLSSWLGHRAGAKNMKKIISAAWENDVRNLTIWGLSFLNVINRSEQELKFLYELFGDYFKKIPDSKEVTEKKAKLRFLGEWRSVFPENLSRIIDSAEKKTNRNGGTNLTFMLAYSGKKEMVSAFNDMLNEGTKVADYDGIKRHLMTKDLPAVDLVIRTGGEPHWSDGFMMWDISDSRFYFTDTLWPDFSKKEFSSVIDKFNRTERRLGK